jgi:DNA polymerase III epsilon subunit family exonuclease
MDNSAYPPYLGEETFVAFDTETTGLWAGSNRIVEIASVKFRLGRGITDTFQALVNPGRPIPPEVTRIHGITDSDVALAEPAGPVLARFREFCSEDSILIAHNAMFDISFVGWELFRSGETFGNNPILDSRHIALALAPGLPSYALLSLAQHFGLAESQEHRALADAELVYRLIARLLVGREELSSREALLGRFVPGTMADYAATETDIPESFAALEQAIEDGRTVIIEYAKEQQPVQIRHVRPLRIHRLGTVLYLNAFCLQVNDERTFRLDRIRSFAPAEQ